MLSYYVIQYEKLKKKVIVESDILSITTGVPQGSILGPLLFIIYIKDIANASNLFNFIIYADYTTLSTTLEIVIKVTNIGGVEAKLNRELAVINDWLKSNKLSLNVIKSKDMIFHTAQKTVIPLQLNIENAIIQRVYEFNFLGLTINENLNWKSHVDKLPIRSQKVWVF